MALTKTDELLGFSRTPYQELWWNSRNTEKPAATRVITAGLPNLQTESDVHWNALWEVSIGLLHPKWLFSWISIRIVHFRPKLFAVSSKSRHRETSTFRYQHSEEDEVVYRSQGLVYRPMKSSDILRRPSFHFSQLWCEFMCGGSPRKLKTLTAIFSQWSTDVDLWCFPQPYRGILSILSLPCMVGSIARIT